MSISERKQREFKQREKLILKTAFELLEEGGYLGLTFDAIAKKIDYAKGTVYKHFSCKEDIVLTLLNHLLEINRVTISRTISFEGCFREKYYAAILGAQLCDKLFPSVRQLKILMLEESIWKKSDPLLKQLHHDLLEGKFLFFVNLIQQAIENNELDVQINPITAQIGAEAIQVGNHVMNCHMQITEHDKCHTNDQPFSLTDHLLDNINTYLDGLNWTPLSTDTDYYNLEYRIFSELFPDIVQKVKTPSPKWLFNE